MIATIQALNHFGRCLPPGKLAEMLLDVLNLQSTLL